MLTSSVTALDAANTRLIKECYGVDASRVTLSGVLTKRSVPHTCFLVGQWFCYTPMITAQEASRWTSHVFSSRRHKLLPLCDEGGLTVRVTNDGNKIVFERKSRTKNIHQKAFEATSKGELLAWKAAITRAVFLWSVAPVFDRVNQQIASADLSHGEEVIVNCMQQLVRCHVSLLFLQMCGDLSAMGKPLVGGWVRGFTWNDSQTLRCGDQLSLVYPRDMISRAALNSASTLFFAVCEKCVAEQVNMLIQKVSNPYARRVHQHLEEVLTISAVQDECDTTTTSARSAAGAVWAGWLEEAMQSTRLFAESVLRNGPDLVSRYWPSAPERMSMKVALRGWLSTFPMVPSRALRTNARENLISRVKSPAARTSVSLSGLRGVHNTGNSCYLNAILQCLAHTPSITRFFLLNSHYLYMSSSVTQDNALAAAVARFVSQLWEYIPEQDATNANRVLYADQVFDALNADCKAMGIPPFSRQQQDAHEALVQLLDCLAEELGRRADAPQNTHSPSASRTSRARPVASTSLLSRAASDTVTELPSYTSATLSQGALIACWRRDYITHNPHLLAKTFSGQTVQTLQCPECQALSYCCDSFMYLFTNFPDAEATCDSVSVESCLNTIFAPEAIDMGGATCGACGEKLTRPATRRIALHRLPPCLILCVNRALMDSVGRVTGKRQTPLRVRQKLALGPWLSEATESSCPQVVSAGCVESLAALDHDIRRRGAYELYAVVLHRGANVNEGHYTAACLVAGTWSHFDDAKVNPISDMDKWLTEKASEVYILFYRSLAPDY